MSLSAKSLSAVSHAGSQSGKRSVFGRFSSFALAFSFSAALLPSGASLSPATAIAQENNGQANQITKVNGKLEGAQGVVLKVTGDDKKEYMVRFPEDPKGMRYSGTATKEWLSPGLFIRFDAQFDAKGKQQGAVRQLEVFVPSQERREDPEYPKNNVPGLYASGVQGGDELFTDGSKKGPSIQSYRVIARVGGVSKDKLKALAGSNTLMVELDPAVTISIGVPGLDFARPGDTIAVNGFTNPAQPTFVIADTIVVTGVEPLGKKPEKGKPEKGKKGSTKGKEEEEKKSSDKKSTDKKATDKKATDRKEPTKKSE